MMGKEKNCGRTFGLLLLVLITAACADYPSGTAKPATGGDTYTTPEDTPLTVAAEKGILSNDTAREGTALTLLTTGKVTTEAGGTVVLEADGSFSYAPPPDFDGVDSLVYQVKNDAGKSNSGVLSVTVVAVNDAPDFKAAVPAPVAEDAGGQTIKGWATFDPGSPTETDQTATYLIDKVSNPGLFAKAPAVAADGTLTFAAAANASGTSTFEVRVKDSGGSDDGGVDTSEPQTFTITVTAVDDAPIVSNIGDQSAVEDTVGTTIAFTVGDPDTALDTLILSAASDNESLVPAARILFGGSGADRTVTLVPAANQNGAATITITVSDGSLKASDTFKWTVAPVNDPPSFTASNPPAVDEDAPAQSIAGWAAGFSPGPANEAGQTSLGYTVSAPSNPALFATPPAVAADGTLAYTPALNANGTSTFTVSVQDSGGTANGGVDRSAAKTFTVTVNPVNDAPVAVADTATTPVSTALNISPVDNDTDVDTANAQLTIVSAAVTTGSGEVAATSRIVLYVPDATLPVPRDDVISYVISDGELTASGTITVTVTAAIVPLTQGADSNSVTGTDYYTTGINRELVVTAAEGVLANDRDPLDAGLIVTSAGSLESLHGGLVQLAADGGFSYTPAANFTGQDSFVYSAAAAGEADLVYSGKAVITVQEEEAKVSLAVSGSATLSAGVVSGLPVASDDNYPAREDQPLIVGRDNGVLINDRDPQGAPLSLVSSGILTSHFGGEVDLEADGGFTYQAAANFAGNDYFTYTISNGTGSDEATVMLRVAAVNDPPRAQDDHYVAHCNAPMAVSADAGVLANDSEADGDPLSVATIGRIATDQGGKIQLLASGAFIYSPPADFSGSDRFDYTASDGQGLFDAATATITVIP